MIKRLLLGGGIFILGAFFLVRGGYSQGIPEKSKKELKINPIKFIEISIQELQVWPVKPSGKCWDPPCFFSSYRAGKELPRRGNPKYNSYFTNKNFRLLCKAPKAPDPYIEIKIGKYEKFVTARLNNSCSPTFNLKHTFRVTPNARFTVNIFDNDGAIGVNFKRDRMGTWYSDKMPTELLRGQTLVLRSFGQIEKLVLKARIVHRPEISSCNGVYKVRIAEFAVQPTKETGKSWDTGFGSRVKPDVVVRLQIGNATLQTPLTKNAFIKSFTNVDSIFTIKKGMSASLKVFDQDLFGSTEKIGETALASACNLINRRGRYTFRKFGQVKKVVLIFEKMR